MKIEDLLIYGTNLKVIDSMGILMDVEGYDFHTNSIICERVQYDLAEVTPVLKRLGDITEEGCSGKVLWRDKHDELSPFKGMWYHSDVMYLVSQGYDLYNFIDEGHAVATDSDKIFKV